MTMRAVVALLLGGLLLMGCATNREKAVQGKWATGQKDGTSAALGVGIAALKGDEQAAGQALAKLMVQIVLDVKPDKTFSLVWDGAERSGMWTFDKTSGDLKLNITKIQPLAGAQAPQNFQPEIWTATLDKENKQLNFYPGNEQVADIFKKSGGPMASGFPLVKQGS